MQDAVGHYWVSLDTTYNALEDMMKVHSDLPLIMDEANLLAATDSAKVRGDIFKALAFKLYNGSLKSRFGGPVERDYRLGFIISSNEPLASLLGQGNDVARAAQDRLITIPIDTSFGSVPKQFRSSSEFAKKLMRSAQRHHGHAIRRFLTGLVKDKVDDEAKLRHRIRRHVERFHRAAGTNLNEGSATRVAEAFGLVYAAGKLAQRYGVLPDVLTTRAAALHCYRLHRNHADCHFATFKSRLLAAANSEQAVLLKKGQDATRGALAFLSRHKGHAELLVPQEHITELFADWDRIKSSREVAAYLQRDGDAYKVKRVILGKKARVYCFHVPKE